jgi:hypothetical protein
MERLGLFFDGNSGAPAFSLPQTKDELEETRRKAAAFVGVRGKQRRGPMREQTVKASKRDCCGQRCA